MKALLAAAVTSVSLVAGLGVNADSQSTTPAAETLVARDEVQVALEEHGRDDFIPLFKDKLVTDKLTKVMKAQ